MTLSNLLKFNFRYGFLATNPGREIPHGQGGGPEQLERPLPAHLPRVAPRQPRPPLQLLPQASDDLL